MVNKTFKRGSGCFTCCDCGKKTRDVNGQNGQLGMCELCQSKAECGNTLSDHGYEGDAWARLKDCKTVAECEQLLAAEMQKIDA